MLWDIKTLTPIALPLDFECTEQVTAVVWTTQPGATWDSVAFGTAKGQVFTWQETRQVSND